MSVNFDYYKVFYYVAKYQNITMAAKALYLSQPTVSRSIQNLENELGCQLFFRSKKGVTLTPEAQLLYNHISKACEHIFKAEEELTSSKFQIEGVIRIGASEMVLHNYLSPYLEKLQEKHPSVKLEITNFTTPVAISFLKAGLIDIAIVTMPVEENASFSITELTSFQDVVIAGSKYKELEGRSLHLSDLSDYPIICMAHDTTTHRFLENVFFSNNTILHSNIEMASLSLIEPLVAHNLGIGIVPYEYAEEGLEDGRIFQLNITDDIPKRHLCAIINHNHQVSVAAKELLSIMKEDLE